MRTLVRIIILIIVLTGVYFFTTENSTVDQPKNTETQQDTIATDDSQTDEPLTPSAEGDASVILNEDQGSANISTLTKDISLPQESATWTVSYTSNGFFPKSITIKKGDTVRFVNNSDDEIHIKSEQNPTYPTLATFESTTTYGSDGIFSYTFKDSGEWRYRNINNQSFTGTIVVK